jgi:zinc D-Ala-D-Ala carboxypeptidase
MQLKHFTLSEFDSPDAPGSGSNMKEEFLTKLDKAREIAGIPFRINSGFRTKNHNISLQKKGYRAVTNSPHLGGWAADIHCNDSVNRFKIVNALLEAGFTRIGIAGTFVHCDCDPTKPQSLIWTY